MQKKFSQNKIKQKQISVLYAYFNTPLEIEASISSLGQSLGSGNFEVIIVDNNSDIPLRPQKRKFPVRIFRNSENKGYGAAINQAAKKAKGKYLLISNTDTVYAKNALKRLVLELSRNPKIGIIGPKMVDENGETLLTKSRNPLFPLTVFIYSSLKNLPLFKSIRDWFHYGKNTTNVDVVGGASMLVSRDLFERVKGFDERFFLFFEEADLCMRIKKEGYTIKYFSGVSVEHGVGKSLQDKEIIRIHFEHSRFKFVEKHQGFITAVISEGLIRFFSFTALCLLAIFILSLFLNLYKITSLMMFFGDFGRDMLVARDIALTGQVPLIGIPSSVVWLHQGPLSIYFIYISFVIGGFQPYVPATFYAVMGAITALFVYVLGKRMFNKDIGLMAAVFFATSPWVIVNARIPYHTAPIPFFTAIFFIFLYGFLKKRTRRYLMLTGFFLGLLFQLELSNGVLFFLVAILFFLQKVKLTLKDFALLLTSFSLGILPFILYDLTHTFIQTGGFIAWVGNRIRLFLGLTASGAGTTSHVPGAVNTIWEQLIRFVQPGLEGLAILVIIISGVFFSFMYIRERRTLSVELLYLGLAIPFLGFLVHAQPGTAYFPLVFPLLSIAIAYLFFALTQKSKVFFLVFAFLICSNILFVLHNNYFLDVNGKKGNEISGWRYGLGSPLIEQERVIQAIKADAGNRSILLVPGGFLRDFKTSIDNYHYIAWVSGLDERPNGRRYIIFHSPQEVTSGGREIYKNGDVTVKIYE